MNAPDPRDAPTVMQQLPMPWETDASPSVIVSEDVERPAEAAPVTSAPVTSAPVTSAPVVGAATTYQVAQVKAVVRRGRWVAGGAVLLLSLATGVGVSWLVSAGDAPDRPPSLPAPKVSQPLAPEAVQKLVKSARAKQAVPSAPKQAATSAPKRKAPAPRGDPLREDQRH